MHRTIADSLRAAAQLGPFFTITPELTRDASQRWLPFTALTSAAGRDMLEQQLAVTSTMLGSEERRTVASIVQLGAAAALCSPFLAVAAISGHVPAVTAEALDFCYPARGPLQLALKTTATAPPTSAMLPELAEQLVVVALDGLLGLFTSALSAIEPVPQPTIAGNAFSSLAAAARLIGPADAGQRARALVDLVARRSPLLEGAGDFHWRQPGSGHAYFRRRNCCLFYRIPGGGTCGDCILD